MTTSFENKKELKFVIILADGTFDNTQNNQITLEGFRAVADIDKAGGQMMGTLRAKIYGVSQADMNSIMTVQWQPGYLTNINTVQVFAIDGDQETLVFSGNIVNAWGDYNAMPDVFLQIQAQSVYKAGLQATAPLSIKGAISVATVMAQIAQGMGLAFENNNVNVTMNNVYVANTLKEQALELARMCNFTLYIDDKTLAITNKYEPRTGFVPTISPQSGLIGYPTFDGLGVNFQILFNPAVTFGGSIQLVTDIVQAQGQWIATSISHRLESEKPNGSWFSFIRGTKNGLAVLS